MIKVLLSFILISASIAWSKSKKQGAKYQFKPVKLSSQQIKDLSFHKRHTLRFSYINFLKDMEDMTTLPNKQEGVDEEVVKFESFRRYFRILEKTYTAYADNGDICFFGGWPSIEQDNLCQPPWKHSDNEDVKSFGPTYNAGTTCNSPDHFRCNPVLFGKPDNNTPAQVQGINLSDGGSNGRDAGYCVNIRESEYHLSYHNIADKCNKASSDTLANYIDELGEDNQEAEAKRQKLIQFHNSIVGENGFCDEMSPRFLTKNGSRHPACEALLDRLARLQLTPDDEIDNPTIITPGVPNEQTNPNYAVDPEDGNVGLALLNKCAEKINEEERDSYGAGFLAYLRDGMHACHGNLNGQEAATAPILSGKGQCNDDDDDNYTAFDCAFMGIERHLETREYVYDLNDINLKDTLQALLVSQYVYMQPNSLTSSFGQVMDNEGNINRARLVAAIKEKFPQYGRNAQRTPKLDAVVDGVIASFNANKSLLPKMNATNYMARIESSATELNKICSDIRRDFQAAPPVGLGGKWKDNWYNWGKSDAAKTWLEEKRRVMQAGMTTFLAETGTASLVGDEDSTFVQKAFDPSEDFAEKCAEDPSTTVMNPNFDANDLKKSLGESFKMILSELGDINTYEGNANYDCAAAYKRATSYGNYGGYATMGASASCPSMETQLENYIKNNKSIVLQSLQMSQGDQLVDRSLYVCKQLDEEYTWDGWRKWGGVGALGLLTVGQLAVCPFTGGSTCGTAFMTGSAAVGLTSAGLKYWDANQRDRTAAQNMVITQDLADYQRQQRIAQGIKTDAGWEAVGAALVFTGPAVKFLRGSGASNIASLGSKSGNAARLTGITDETRFILGGGGGQKAITSGVAPRALPPAGGSTANVAANTTRGTITKIPGTSGTLTQNGTKIAQNFVDDVSRGTAGVSQTATQNGKQLIQFTSGRAYQYDEALKRLYLFDEAGNTAGYMDEAGNVFDAAGNAIGYYDRVSKQFTAGYSRMLGSGGGGGGGRGLFNRVFGAMVDKGKQAIEVVRKNEEMALRIVGTRAVSNERSLANKESRDEAKAAGEGAQPETIYITASSLADQSGQMEKVGRNVYLSLSGLSKLPSDAIGSESLEQMSATQAKELIGEIYPGRIEWDNPQRVTYMKNRIASGLSKDRFEGISGMNQLMDENPNVKAAVQNLESNERIQLDQLFNLALGIAESQ